MLINDYCPNCNDMCSKDDEEPNALFRCDCGYVWKDKETYSVSEVKELLIRKQNQTICEFAKKEDKHIRDIQNEMEHRLSEDHDRLRRTYEDQIEEKNKEIDALRRAIVRMALIL